MHNIINLIKINYKLNNFKFKTILNTKEHNIIKIFIKLNIVKFIKKNIFTKKKLNNEYYIYLNYLKNKPVFYNIQNMYRPSFPKYINLKQIKKLNKKNNKLFYISTNRGLLSNIECEKFKCGGLIIMLLII